MVVTNHLRCKGSVKKEICNIGFAKYNSFNPLNAISGFKKGCKLGWKYVQFLFPSEISWNFSPLFRVPLKDGIVVSIVLQPNFCPLD